MKYRCNILLLLLIVTCIVQRSAAQNPAASDTVSVDRKLIILSEVVVSNRLNVPLFIERVKSDSTFYKAFRNLHLVNYRAINDVRMLTSEGQFQASLFSKTRQIRNSGCRRMEVEEEHSTGDFYNSTGGYNYYTAEMYAGLFFTRGIICGESPVVGNYQFSLEGKSGMEKHKEQLKMLFFNPGKRISGLPFMSGKTAVYDDEMAAYYDFSVDMEAYNHHSCYVFRQKVKPGAEDDVVLDEMVTWFDDKTFEVVARNYSLSYKAAVYDFQVNMEVQMTHCGDKLVPGLIRYVGNWKALFKKRERGVFTATLYDFKPE